VLLKKYDIDCPSLLIVERGHCVLLVASREDYLRQMAQLNILGHVLKDESIKVALRGSPK
jgi:hypothetical protein